MANKPVAFYFEGFGGFVSVLGSMEQVPQKCVTRAAGKGATVIRRAIRSQAPVDTGALKRGSSARASAAAKRAKRSTR